MLVNSIQSNAQTLLDQLSCPVLLEPLSEAVSLVPCAHKIQKAAAEKIFGSSNGGWLVQSEKPCPICRVTVLGYMEDHSTRNIVKQLFELPQNEINGMLALMKENLSEKSMSVEKDVLIDIPYPGKPARFIHCSGNWDLFDVGAELCRSINFKSSTEGSLLKEFSIFGYRDGNVCIRLIFSKNSDEVKDYLKQFELIPDWLELEHGYISENKGQLKFFFNIIANNNEIPISHFEMIRDIVAKGTHKS